MSKTTLPLSVNLSPEPFSEFLKNVRADEELLKQWNNLSTLAQQEIQSYYDNTKIPRITSDPLFKHIFNPSTHPERLAELLSLILGFPVTVIEVLPDENIPLSFYSKQVILDILVKLSDGSFADVEIQRIALDFSPQRAAVLSSNLITRQYTIMSEQKKSEVDYSNVKKVYTIVLFEEDYPDFKNHPNDYLHKSSQVFNTGVSVDLLQEYIFVELGKFNRIVSTIDSKLDAWLKFMIASSPYDLIDLITKFSSFQNVYSDVTMFLSDRKELMSMIFASMAEMDDRSIKNMLKRMEKQTNENVRAAISERDAAISERNTAISEKNAAISEKNAVISEKDAYIKQLEALLKKS